MATKQPDIILQHVRKIRASQELEQLSDRELLLRYAQGREEAAFAMLVRRHGSMVLQSCQRLLHNWHDAEDAFQATFLVLARKAARHKWDESVGTWLYLVAYRLALKIRAARDRSLPSPPCALERSPQDPLVVASSRELCGVLDDELSRLPEKCRAPLVLCSLDGFTRDEAARHLGWSLSTFRRRLEQGRVLLRQRLARRGLPLSAIFATAVGVEEVARATVPLGLGQATVQMAMQSLLASAAPAALQWSRVAALAEGVLKGMCVSKLKIGLAAILVVGVAGAGGSVAWRWLPTLASVEERPSEARRWAIQEAGGRPEPNAGQPGFDRYGDPLPPEAVARLGTSRFWCGANFRIQVAFTPDGNTILAQSTLGIFILDATTGKQFRHINAFAAHRSVDGMSVSPDGKHLALATHGRDDNTGSGIQVWDLATGQMLRECHDTGRQQYLGVRFSPDNKLLASYSFHSKNVYIWDAVTGTEIRRWPLALRFGECFTFSPDSTMLIVGDLRTIHFWDIASGKEVRRIDAHPEGCIYRLFLSPDARLLATQALAQEPKVGEAYQQDHQVHLWDAATGEKLRSIEPVPSQINWFQFSPDTKTLVTANGDRMLHVCDVATGKELRRWDAGGWLSSFAFSPDGKKLASLGGDNTVRLWDAATGQELREHPCHRQGIYALAVSSDGHRLATAGWDPDVCLWDAATGRPRHRLHAGSRSVAALHFAADGRSLTTLGDDGNARVWDVATGKELRQFQAPVEPPRRPHVISPDGKLWASGSGSGVVIWDAASGKQQQVCVGEQGLQFPVLGFSADRGALYSWSFLGGDSKVCVWDVSTGKKQREFTGCDQARHIRWGSFSPDGNWLAGGGGGKVLLLCDMATGSTVHRVEVPALPFGNSRGFAISPDSRTLAVGDEDGTIHLVELASGKFRRRFVGGHQGNINVLIFSADGKRLISGSTDTTAVVWDLTGRPPASARALSAADLDACWTDLASDDAERAYECIRRLVASPAEMALYLGKHLQPAVSVDAERVNRLIVDLASNQFAVRDRASKELQNLGEGPIAACRKALANAPSLELRRRLETLVEKQEQERKAPSSQRLRMLRVLEALEGAGTPQTWQLLQQLADGAPEAYLTREAKAALERLARQPARRS